MKMLLVFVAAIAFGQSPRSPLYPVGGVVVDEVSGKPVRGVAMVIGPSMRKDNELARTVSDEQGRFAFSLPQGSYELRAERLGVRPQAYQQEAFGMALASSLIVKDGQKLDQLVFRLKRPAVITGTVKNEFDEPVSNAKVHLFESAVRMGRRSFTYRQVVYTNFEGKYRLYGLDQGSYWLMAEGEPWYRYLLPSGKNLITYGRVVYPNAADFSGGAPLVVGAGESAEANFRLRTEKATKIKVTLPDPSKGTFAGGSFRVLIPSRDGHLVPLVNVAVKDYGIEPIFLSPGNYRVQFSSGDRKSIQTFDEVVAVTGDEMNLEIKPRAPVPVRVRAKMDGAMPPNADLVYVDLYREETGQFGRRQVNVPGEVTFDFLEPGKYLLRGGSKELYIQSTQIGERLLEENRFEHGSEPVTVDVTLTGAGGRVRGIVREDSRPVAGAVVVLGRQLGPTGAVWAYTFQTDSDGSFDWPLVRPGNYSLFALRSGSVEFFQGSVFEKLKPLGKAVTVADKAQVVEDLELK